MKGIELEKSNFGGFYISFHAWGSFYGAFICPNDDAEHLFNMLKKLKLGDRIMISKIGSKKVKRMGEPPTFKLSEVRP